MNSQTTRRRQGPALRQLAVSLRTLLVQLSFFIFLAAAGGLMLAAHNGSEPIRQARTRAVDAIAPLLSAAASPVQAWSDIKASVRMYFSVHEENAQLRLENTQLRRLQGVTVELESENRRLREMLRFLPDPAASFSTAKVVGVAGGPYRHSIIVNSGKEDGVTDGQAVVSKDSLVGRIFEAGSHSARVLLITDLESRIPVITSISRERAILAGNEEGLPTLLYLPENTKIQSGEKIVTSGDGKFYPAGIQVGIVRDAASKEPAVQPITDWNSLEYVNIIDYQLQADRAAAKR